MVVVGCGASGEVYPSRVNFFKRVCSYFTAAGRAPRSQVSSWWACAVFLASPVELSHFQKVTESEGKRHAGPFTLPPPVVSAFEPWRHTKKS